MRILIINPNSTTSMTDLVAAEARKIARQETQIFATNPTKSPPAIQGADDGAAALPHLIEAFDEALQEHEIDAAIIACFDDTGLSELRARCAIPVIGIGEAAYHAAMLLAAQFTVVTTLPVSVPVLEGNIEAYGFGSRCAKVRSTNIPVLELDANPDTSKAKIEMEIESAMNEEKPGAIVLGCAGMADMAVRMHRKFRIPVIDGVKAAVGLCEMLIGTTRT